MLSRGLTGSILAGWRPKFSSQLLLKIEQNQKANEVAMKTQGFCFILFIAAGLGGKCFPVEGSR